MSSFISYLISGISLGSVYAIIALGYTMVYGIAKMLNFAHGDVIMVGSYVVYVAVSGMGLNPILAILLSIIICTLMGVVIEGVAYRPLRNAASPLAVLITAIGVSYLLQNVALLIWGADTKSFSNVISLPSLKLAGGSIVITGVTIVTIIGGILIMAGLMLFIAVFGGIGSIPGAFIGGVVLGILEIFGKAYISSQMADAIVFGVLIVVLVVKPTGILGKNIQEKV